MKLTPSLHQTYLREIYFSIIQKLTQTNKHNLSSHLYFSLYSLSSLSLSHSLYSLLSTLYSLLSTLSLSLFLLYPYICLSLPLSLTQTMGMIIFSPKTKTKTDRSFDPTWFGGLKPHSLNYNYLSREKKEKKLYYKR